MTNLSDLFTYSDENLSLSQEDEAQAIRDAQAGDDSAKERLLLAYGPALRSAVFRFTKGVRSDRDPWAGGNGSGTGAFATEDAENAAVVAFLETLRDHDPEKSPRLAGALPGRISRELSDLFESVAPFQIPERTLSRFYGILQEADGDADVAVEIAPDFHMTRETFRAVLAAVRSTGSLDDATGNRSEAYSSNGGGFAEGDGWSRNGEARSFYGNGGEALTDVEDAILVEEAFRAVDDEEARICELAYGFTEYDTVPDAEIAHRVGLTRPTVQRKRSGALAKMRKALGALEEQDWKE